MKTLMFVLICCVEFFPTCQQSIAQPKWRELLNAPRTNSRFDDIFFINPREGWIIQGRGEIFRTTDGGATWQLQSNLAIGGLRSIGFANAA